MTDTGSAVAAGKAPHAAGNTSAVAVYPLVPTRSFDDALTYELPASLREQCVIGSLVQIPLGTRSRVGVVAEVNVAAEIRSAAADARPVDLKSIERVLEITPVPQPLIALAEWTADTYGAARTRALALVVPPALAAHARAARHSQRIVMHVRAMPHGGDAAAAVSQRAREIASALPAEWSPVASVLADLKTTRETISRLAVAGLAETELRPVPVKHRASAQVDGPADTPLQLSDEQQVALDAILASAPADPATLLCGITGSGKTEVYLYALAHHVQQGRGAIVLVPEIALTPQTAARFRRRFPGIVEVLHSALTRAEKTAAYERVASGQRRVVVGPRSAVFAPVRDLGVIVIDEEHDGSYKQESDPRYDARRVAYRRAQLEGAAIVFGSATPRPESWHGIPRRARLRERPGGGRLAPVEIVDLRLHGDRFPLTEPLRAGLDNALRRGNKAVVLHNRRGYATTLHCRGCGEVFRCPNCDVSLTVHGARAAAQALECHHCGHTAAAPRQCPHCASADVARMGAGTERLERDLRDAFDVPVMRLDADAARERGAVETMLREFARPGPAILTGTQMIAKGHDFPDVELAAVVDADTALAIPDFRAEERAFSMVAQLAGRAGRSAQTADRARVLVQSWNCEAPHLVFAAAHNVEGFLAEELQRREAHAYPPFVRLVRLLISAPQEGAVREWARAARLTLDAAEAGPVLGPAPLLRINNRHRSQLVVKTSRARLVAAVARSFARSTESRRRKHDVRVVLDVDPQALI